jgi:protein-tyrosine phosphatase
MTLHRPASSVTAVSTRLFLGSLADAEWLAKDNPHQIQTVITLCEESVKRRAAGIRYLQFSIRDVQPIPIALLSAILEAIFQAVAEGATLVHCHAGLSRAPTLIAAFLDQTGSVRFEEAIRFLRKLRPEIAPSPNLIQSVTSQIVCED